MTMPPRVRNRFARVRIGGPKLSGEWPAFDSAFGQFIRQFGATETSLSIILESFTVNLIPHGPLATDVLRALIGSRRTPDLATATNLCLKAAIYAGKDYTDNEAEIIKSCFSHLSEIRFLRDRTAHYGISVEQIESEIYFRVVNRWTVNDIDKAERILFQVKHLTAATSDLVLLRERIESVLFKSIAKQRGGVSRDPWLYKPSELIRQPYHSGPNPPQPSPRPPPSLA